MLALRVLLHASIGVAFLLLAAWLGLNAWAEIERGWWREEAARTFERDAPPTEQMRAAEIPDDWFLDDGFSEDGARDGWRFYIRANNWYRTFVTASGEPHSVRTNLVDGDLDEVMAAGNEQEIATYVANTQPFVDLLNRASEAKSLHAPFADGMASNLCTQVRLVLSWRIRHHLKRPDGMPDALEALHTLFRFVRTLPSSSLPIAHARTSLFRFAIYELRDISLRSAFPAESERPAFDEHLRALESNADIVGALIGERQRVIRGINEKLEPGATREGWRRPSWRALTLDGEHIPRLYRNAATRLRVLGTAAERIRSGNTDVSDLAGMVSLEQLLAHRQSARAAARVTRLGLAAIEFHLEQGEWPKDPSILEPRFRDGMPVDPDSGQLFPFQSTRDELLLSTSNESDKDSWLLRREP